MKVKPLKHSTAAASYYNTRAEYYDEFNEDRSRGTNTILEQILKDQNIQTVLDLTCGTGSQVFWLHKAEFDVVGVDINARMLKIAREKAKAKEVKIKFKRGDCRNIKMGHFDAAVTMFNSIGHLTKEDFQKTCQNISQNLKEGGIYVFDIFNSDYLKEGQNISKLTIDWLAFVKGQLVREVQFSTISETGVLASYSTYVYPGIAPEGPKIIKGYGNTLLCYNSDEIRTLLEQNGFNVLEQMDELGKKFNPKTSERILTVAKKRKIT
ncbi:MAG: class I SAM-dependent methyltransferase [Alphaproteobacteria bacterium]